MKKLYALIIALLVMVPSLKASHVAGGNITYRNIGPNQYILTLTLYRDCSGAFITPFGSPTTPPPPATIFVRNNCGGAPFAVTVFPMPGTGVEVPTPCVDDPSTCQGGTRYGIQRFDWEGTVTLPTSTTAACNEFYFTWGQTATAGLCCRNNNNSLSNAPGGGGTGAVNFFIDSYLNNNITPGNNSARLASFEVPAYCVSEPVTVRFDVSEIDGDSVVYSLVAASTGWNQPSNYQAGKSAAVPAAVLNNTITIDPNNGNLSFFSTTPQTVVFCLKIDEFRNGVLIGYVKVDVQVILGTGRFCDNITPTYLNDTVAVQCGTPTDLDFVVNLASRVQCNTISTDASEFRLYNPSGQLIQLRSAAPGICDAQDRTTVVNLRLVNPLDENGFYYLVSRTGSDGNTLGNQCQKFMDLFDTLVISVSNCPEYRKPMEIINVSVDTINPNALILQWAEPDTLNYNWFLAYNLHRAAPGENILSTEKRFHQEFDPMVRSFRDVYSPVLPKDAPISFNMNLILINGKQNLRSNTVTSMRLINDPPSVADDETVLIKWTRYNGWANPEYVVQEFDGNKVQEGWQVVAGPFTDTSYVREKPKPKGQYQLRVVTRNPNAPLQSFSNPIDYEVPGREIEIPNVITPNGDGANDVFFIENLEYYPGARLYIFNRWGQELYSSMDYRNNWGGEGLSAGNYYYHLYVFDQLNDKQYQGTLKIIK
ncbi:MAG: gliding motility-associated C-terminal domain-containing protein [Sphingobacteriaceae bacterium]|nr:gliding motility-associated C-terminal domain-containing protein [Sphingobacteriaceae bacterium]